MSDKKIAVIYGIALTLPLCISLFYLLKIIINSKRKDRAGKFALKLIASFIFFLVASFLIFFIAIKFFMMDVKIPNWLNILGIFIFMLYYGAFGGFLFGLGELGQVGASPSKIVRELYNDFFKRGK